MRRKSRQEAARVGSVGERRGGSGWRDMVFGWCWVDLGSGLSWSGGGFEVSFEVLCWIRGHAVAD
jgi:hypothetical protein